MAWLEGPEDKRLSLMMLQDGQTIKIAILRAIGKRLTNLRTGKELAIYVLPPHGQWREMPAWGTGDACAGIGALVAGHTVQSRHTSAFGTANNVEQVLVAIITLVWMVRGSVAIDATSVGQH